MGEIANAIINGDLCSCGCALETEGQGFPRACSKECAKDYNCPVEDKAKATPNKYKYKCACGFTFWGVLEHSGICNRCYNNIEK